MQTKVTDPELVLAAWHAEGRLELVLLADAKLSVGTGEIDLGAEASTSASGLIDELLDVEQRFRGALQGSTSWAGLARW
jgi:hypothetical protein